MKKSNDIPIKQVILGQVNKCELKAVPIDSLVPYKKNANKGDVDKVALSLKEFGYVKNSVLIDEKMVLIAGHTTLAAMKKLGWDKVPEVTQVSGLTENQKKAYRLMDNQAGRSAEWDLELLVQELNELKMDKFDLTLTGFDNDEIKKIEQEVNPQFNPIPESEVPRLDQKKKVVCPECGHEFTPT